MSFEMLLSPEQRAHLRAVKIEIERLFGLPDRWLAEELLRQVRECRAFYSEKLGDPLGHDYDINFVWHVVPEIARRLGASRLQPNERVYGGLSDEDLRQVTGITLQNLTMQLWSVQARLACRRSGSEIVGFIPGEILCHCVQNGNPVAFAMDRICPASSLSDDLTARLVREVSRVRGHNETPHWNPGLSVARKLGGQVLQ